MAEQFYYPIKEEITNLNDYTFIMPIVAAGNVGQLSIDLLISNLNVQLLGRFHHYSITPIVGGDPYSNDSKSFTTACQLYICTDQKLVILQQRSPILPTCRQKFVSLISDWIKNQSFKATIILSSAFNHFQTENDKIHKVQYLANLTKISEGTIVKEKLTKLKEIGSLIDNANNFDLPGAGITEILFKKLQEMNESVIVISCFCSEGDNTPDAIFLVEHFNQIKPVLKIDQGHKEFKWPISWSCLYGNKAPKSIY